MSSPSIKGPARSTTLPANSNKTVRQQVAGIAAALALGATAVLSGCAPSDTNDGQTTQQEQTLNQSRLVQGRDNCIKALIEQGTNQQEAIRACDDAFAQAMADAQKRGEDTRHYYSGGGGNNAFLWYLIGRNSAPSVYYGNPSEGVRYVGGGRGSDFRPPAFSREEVGHYSKPPGARPSVAPRGSAFESARGGGGRYGGGGSWGGSRGGGSYSTGRGGFGYGSGIS